MVTTAPGSSARPASEAGGGVFRWTRERYERAVDAGVLTPDDKVELLDGEIRLMPPHKTPHAVAVSLAFRALFRVFGQGYEVRCQLPIILDDESEPEPDLAVAKGDPRDYLGSHPDAAALVLIVEVADATVDYDRTRKRAAYARNGIPEYWIVDLTRRRIEVSRDPDPSADRYTSVRVVEAGGRIVPGAEPGFDVAVADLLP